MPADQKPTQKPTPRFDVEPWGEGEYVVTRNHIPIGRTVCYHDAIAIKRWLTTPGLFQEITHGPTSSDSTERP